MSDSPPPKQDSGSFMLIFVFMLTFFIMFNEGMRMMLAGAVHTVFFPIIGFELSWPVLTILLAGVVMTLISMLIRHKFMDWIGMARNQVVMKAFNKEMREARLGGDKARLDKLMKQQKVIMQAQMSQQNNQMKPMVFSMIIIISIFTWVYMFLAMLENQTFSLPWAPNVSLMRGGPVFQIMPVWIGVYSLVSIPLGQVLQKALKEYTFKKRLEKMAEEPEIFQEEFVEPETIEEDIPEEDAQEDFEEVPEPEDPIPETEG
ncbi:MAG: EMC3/TMCO1 family protein [Candidatus Thermoplasmatota archaeon]|nr:EMC3/TMCO1 family protein [Candidatus Thermoplasmatota archaeon]